MSIPRPKEIERYFIGSWRMMTGRPDGIQKLDMSVDGFWRSFHAITVAVPALFAGWIAYAFDLSEGIDDPGLRAEIVVTSGVTDILAWVAPVVFLALAARRLGLSKRFSVYVIASNWGGALLSWLTLPPTIIRLIWPEARDLSLSLSLLFFAAELVLSYRLTQAALQRPHSFALPLFIALTASSLVVTVALQNLFGIAAPI